MFSISYDEENCEAFCSQGFAYVSAGYVYKITTIRWSEEIFDVISSEHTFNIA